MSYFVTGTDTDVGKTVVAAWLMLHLDGDYWKPVQCGLEDGTDADAIKVLTGLPSDRIRESTYVLADPLSPHEAARRAGVTIDMGKFELPASDRTLIVEGAGGLMVPLTKESFVIDLIGQLNLPVVLVCRSTLGTINHTLLSIEALRTRGLEIAGLVLSGPKLSHNRQAIEEYGQAKILGEIPPLSSLNREALIAIPPEFDLKATSCPSL